MVGVKRISIEDFVAHKLPSASVKLFVPDFVTRLVMAPALPPNSAELFRRQKLKFLDRVLNGPVDGAATQAFVGDSINQKVVEALSYAVDYRVGSVFEHDASHIRGSRLVLDKVIDITAV